MIIDGDHNYYTVSEELRMIAERAEGSATCRLLIFHDVGWPHARRDTYYAPERIPEQHRQPLAQDAELAPGEPARACRDQLLVGGRAGGGPRNGVLTAVEDFMVAHAGLRLAIVPAFFGLGRDVVGGRALGRRRLPTGSTLGLEPDARSGSRPTASLSIVDRIRLERQEEVLRAMLNSRAFALAEAMSRLRQRGGPGLLPRADQARAGGVRPD